MVEPDYKNATSNGLTPKIVVGILFRTEVVSEFSGGPNLRVEFN